MVKRKSVVDENTFARLRIKAAKTDGLISIESKAGRVYIAKIETINCKPAVVEFVDTDGWHLKLAYQQLLSVDLLNAAREPSTASQRPVRRPRRAASDKAKHGSVAGGHTTHHARSRNTARDADAVGHQACLEQNGSTEILPVRRTPS